MSFARIDVQEDEVGLIYGFFKRKVKGSTFQENCDGNVLAAHVEARKLLKLSLHMNSSPKKNDLLNILSNFWLPEYAILSFIHGFQNGQNRRLN